MTDKALIAIELADLPAQSVLDKAKSALREGQQCDVVTVVDPTSVGYSMDPTMSGKMYEAQYDQAVARAKKRLQQLCESADLPVNEQIVRYGRVAHEVHELLHSGKYDCLMIGSHGYHGWQRVLGSKASSILHGVPVDTYIFATPKL